MWIIVDVSTCAIEAFALYPLPKLVGCDYLPARKYVMQICRMGGDMMNNLNIYILKK